MNNKINILQPLFDMNGEVLIENILDTKAVEFYNTNGAFPIKYQKPQTIKSFVLQTINTAGAKENENIVERTTLFVKIISNLSTDIDLTAEDIVLIKTCAKKIATPIVYAQLDAVLSGKTNPLSPIE